MKQINIEQTATTFFIPAVDLLAVWNATSNEDARYYLNGAFLESHKDGQGVETLNLIATDGHVLMQAALPEGAFMGEDCATQKDTHTAGFILRTDIAEKAFKAKTRDDLWIYGDTETGILQFIDTTQHEYSDTFTRVGVCEFSRIDGTFPDWRRVLPKDDQAPEGCACFNPDLLEKFRKARDAYARHGFGPRGASIRMNPGDGAGPMRIELANTTRFTGALMPVRWETATRYAA